MKTQEEEEATAELYRTIAKTEPYVIASSTVVEAVTMVVDQFYPGVDKEAAMYAGLELLSLNVAALLAFFPLDEEKDWLARLAVNLAAARHAKAVDDAEEEGKLQ